ncbi:MAG: ABC transporter ATP-binding protein/permease [Oscillospiraceae bacterium]|nr:ABC transporter ATP-binding protein/permease [Oscillospiraceae bacterium]
MDKKLNYFSAVKFLSKYIKKHKKTYILFYIGWLFTTLLQLYIPITFAVMIDEIVYYKNTASFLSVSMLFAVMLLFLCVLYYFSDTHYSCLRVLYNFDIRKDVFDSIQNADAQYMSDVKTGDIIAAIQSYAEECMPFVIQNIIHLINNTSMLILYVIYVFLLGWQIGLLMSIAVMLSVVVSYVFGKKIRNYSAEQRKNYGEYSGWLFEILSGLRDIRMLGAEKTADKSFIGHQRKMINVNIKSGLFTMTAQNIITAVNLLVQLSIFGVAAYMAHENNITIGLLVLILAYFANITRIAGTLSNMNLEAQNRISYIQRIRDIANAPSEKDWKGKSELVVTAGRIKFNNIGFAYNKSSDVLKNFTLEIKGDAKLALVGKSGSGKTTLAYMLVGFYRPSNGWIEIDGQRLDECSLASIRDNIGIIQQESLIFDGSIKDNLLLGKRTASDDEMITACQRAGIYEYIQELPDGINTVVGKEGTGLSGGQKQRLAIARIYLKNPKIIIFDEATSSLDSETEAQIHEAWEKVLIGRTSIVIAHRQSSVMLCREAAILENGRLAETGTPADMIQNSETFKTLFAVKDDEGGLSYV